MKAPFLSVTNHHHESCGEPPAFESGSSYLSYFENEHGEQWVFSCDRESGVFFICGGDIQWGNRRVGVKEMEPLLLTEPERFWVWACLGACGQNEAVKQLVKAWLGHDEEIAENIRALNEKVISR